MFLYVGMVWVYPNNRIVRISLKNMNAGRLDWPAHSPQEDDIILCEEITSIFELVCLRNKFEVYFYALVAYVYRMSQQHYLGMR